MRTLAKTLRGSFILAFMGLNTVLHGAVLLPASLLKALTPAGRWRNRVRSMLARIAESWIGVNNGLLALDRGTTWDLELPEGIDVGGCYLVVCNHQSWVDILVLQRAFNRRLPLMRFFLKRQLIWVPILGLCWWALDFPFMRRATKEQLARRPELRGRDLASARRACEKFRDLPVAMMSFPEGTRRAGHKRHREGDYRHLLAPKAGGVGQVIFALGDQLDGCVDATLAYRGAFPDGAPTLWQLVTGGVQRITLRADCVPIPSTLVGRDFTEDREARQALQAWLTERWRRKDAVLESLEAPRD